MVWSVTTQNSFETVKKLILGNPEVALFDPSLPTNVIRIMALVRFPVLRIPGRENYFLCIGTLEMSELLQVP